MVFIVSCFNILSWICWNQFQCFTCYLFIVSIFLCWICWNQFQCFTCVLFQWFLCLICWNQFQRVACFLFQYVYVEFVDLLLSCVSSRQFGSLWWMPLQPCVDWWCRLHWPMLVASKTCARRGLAAFARWSGRHSCDRTDTILPGASKSLTRTPSTAKVSINDIAKPDPDERIELRWPPSEHGIG